MLQNYQLLRDVLNPKFTESQQHFQYRQWLESLSRYELEAQQPLDDNLKIAKAKGSQETTKEKEKDTTKEEKDTTEDGIHGIKEDTTNKGQGKSKGKGGKTGATTQCHICKKFGHVAANCWYKDSTYTTAAVGSGTTGQRQHYSMDNPANDQPVALMPRDQLPLYNQHGQCISGTYMQATSAPRAATSSTASYITTPGPVLHNISHVHCEEANNLLEINYNRQQTSSMNHNSARELPAHYLKHWGLLVDTGAYVSVAPEAFRSGGTT